MRARFVAELGPDDLLDAEQPIWAKADVQRLSLGATPLGMQPTAYIQASWRERPIGSVTAVRVSALHDGERLAFRLEWEDASEDRALADDDRFPDAAAVLLPSVPLSPLITMGAPGAAVNAWYWRADEARAREIVAEGIGTTRGVSLDSLRATGIWKEGRWRVVIARALDGDAAAPVAKLRPGETTGFGVAVWDGSRGERAGLKSYSGPAWHELALDALSGTGR